MRLLRQSTAFTYRIGPFVDDTDGVTAETGLSIAQADIQISKDGGAFAQTSDSSPTTTHDADGWYQCPFTTTDTNTLGPMTVQIKMAGALPVWEHFTVVSAAVYDALVDDTGDGLRSDVQAFLGTTIAETTGGNIAANFDEFFDNDDALTSKVVDDVGGSGSGGIAASVSGTADSGTTTTLVDAAALNQTDDDYWNGQLVRFTSGTLNGQTRLITDFDAGTDTITFYPATTTAVTTHTYEILPAGDSQALAAIYLNYLLSDSYDATSPPGQSDALLAEMTEDDSGVTRFTQAALSQAGGGSGVGASFSSSADSGSTTTLVDSALTEADDDYWVGSIIRFTSGTLDGQCRTITSFSESSNTLTFAPAATQAVSTHSYEIIPAAADVRLVDLTEDNSGTWRFTQAALAEGDGAGPSVSGTADSGSTTTLVDSALTQADDDHWIGSIVRFTSGTISGQARLITDFDASTDTITFTPATTSAVSTNTYQILPSAAYDALRDIHLDHLLANDYDPASKPGTATSLLNELVENDSGVSRFTANALEQGTGGSGLSASVSGTADSGSTTTLVDSALTQADDDYWIGSTLRFTSGNIEGQCRLITDFDESSNTITFTPATTQAVSGQGYEILPSIDPRIVFDATMSDYETAGTIGKAVSDAGDPWSTAVPGSFTSGQAGYVLDQILDLLGTPADTDIATDIANLVTTIGTPADTDIATDIANLGATLGSGANTVTITVDDGSSDLENATVRMVEGATVVVGQTDSNGDIAFSLDDATYAITITKAGYSFTPTTQVVSGTTSATHSMTLVASSPPASALKSTGRTIVYDENGDPESGVEVSCEMTAGPGTAGQVLDTKVRTETSAVTTGLVEFEGLIQGATYRIWRGGASGAVGATAYSQRSYAGRAEFTVPAASSFDIPEVIGVDAE